MSPPSPHIEHGPVNADHPSRSPLSPVTWREALRTWAYIGLNSFGGPTGQIAVMHKVLVDEKRWISDARFLHALNYCMLLPGPEAMQLATYVGWLLHRTWGGILAGSLFVLPGFVAILALSIAYTSFADVAVVGGVLFGLKAAVLAIVVEAVIRIGRRVLKNRAMYLLAIAAFVAIFFFNAPFPIIIGAAALIGLLGDRYRPDLFEVVRLKSADDSSAPAAFVTDAIDARHTQPSLSRTVRTIVIWCGLWFAPILALGLWVGRDHVFFAESVFFSKAAVVTFGGAYAVLAYMAQQAVEVYGWLLPGEMLTGLGMAETTPGPLIQVVQFVGYMGAYRDPGSLQPVLAGVLASIITTWVTFIPCFLWIFAGAPYMEFIRGRKSLTAALSCITAAVVGVVLNLSVWLALHTLFSRVYDVQWTISRFAWPDLTSIQWPMTALAGVSALLIFRLHWGVLRTLAVTVLLGIPLSLI